MEKFKINSGIHNIKTRYKHDHHPSTNLANYQKDVYFAGMKFFDTITSNVKHFKSLYKSIKTIFYLTYSTLAEFSSVEIY